MIFLEIFLILGAIGLVIGGVASKLPESAWVPKDIPLGYLIAGILVVNLVLSVCSTLFASK